MKTTIEIWNNNLPQLTRFVKMKVKDADLTQDILQELFIRFYSSSGNIDLSRARPWLWKVAANLVTDHFRALSLERNKFYGTNESDTDNNSVNERFSKCLGSFIGKLPAKYRDAIYHSDIREVDQVQLAKNSNVSYSGMKSRVQRARKMLKEMFLGCCQVSADKYGNIIEHETKSTCKTCMV